MKQITINGKVYNIECNAFTYVKYKSFFKTGIMQDMQIIKGYLVKQSVVSEYVKEENATEETKISEIADYMRNDVDEFITKVTQIAWILIYTANNKIEDYETWLKSITKFQIDDDWIVEVTEFAVDCFC